MSAEMRRRLIDHARRHMAQKRGGRVIHEPLDSSVTATAPDDASEIEARLSRLDEALAKLNADFPRALQVVQLRFLAGLTAEETASQLDLSVGTVKRDWDIRPCMARSRDGIRRQGLSQTPRSDAAEFSTSSQVLFLRDRRGAVPTTSRSLSKVTKSPRAIAARPRRIARSSAVVGTSSGIRLEK